MLPVPARGVCAQLLARCVCHWATFDDEASPQATDDSPLLSYRDPWMGPAVQQKHCLMTKVTSVLKSRQQALHRSPKRWHKAQNTVQTIAIHP